MARRVERARWVGAAALVALGASGIAPAKEGMQFTPSQRAHWAWKKPVLPPTPRVRNEAWVRNPVDAFILARLEARGLKPSPTASRETLIRRLAFDLTGLPPTPEEVAAFVVDPAPDAYDRLVDRTLASPAYGERWARHWLDLARYADSNGYEFDEARPDAWRYRDYVVRSFNEDKPYDRFITEQLAGDLLVNGSTGQRVNALANSLPHSPIDPREAAIATGFNLLGPDMTDAADQEARRQNTLNDMTDTAGLVFLGLTVGCARCHDHKYEPISQADYYRLQAHFAAARFRRDIPVGTPDELARFAREQAAYEEKVRRVREQMDAVAGPVGEMVRQEKTARLPEEVLAALRTSEKQRTVDQQQLVDRNLPGVEPLPKEIAPRLASERRERYETLAGELRTLEAAKPSQPVAMGLEDRPAPLPPTFILERGEPANRGAEVSPAFPVILGVRGVHAAQDGSGRRLALARWIASRDNPLTARVMVNRVWQHLFDRGIVPTPSDFGLRGESPTHPELLDWLACSFAAGVRGQELGVRVRAASSPTPNPQSPTPWSIKSLLRLLLTSNTYKQSSRASAETLAADPENALFSRMGRKRLEAEAVRDAVLAVSGPLSRKAGGPGVFPPLPPDTGVTPKVWPASADPEEARRRSLYIFVRRNLRYPVLEAFDSPDTNLSCARREVTTSAPQALALINSAGMLEAARSFAGRVLAGAADEPGRVTLAYRLALGRVPTAGEVRTAREFLGAQGTLLRGRPRSSLALPQPLSEGCDPVEGAAWTDYCLALMNLNEFVYLD